MKEIVFNLNESGSARLIVNVIDRGPFVQDLAPALIHVPGGGFMFCSESDTINLGGHLQAKGAGVIATYLYPVAREYRYPQVIVDMMRSIKILRDHASEWRIDPHKIIISGNSAGSFICMTTGNLWNRPELMEKAGCTGEEGKPDVMILGFGPMFCGQQTDDGLAYVPNGDLVGAQTPPAFFHHARKDNLVSVYQTIAMIDSMEKAGRPYSCFISGFGDHGETGMSQRMQAPDGTVGPCIDDWFEACWHFIQNVFKLPQGPVPMPVMEMAPMPMEMLPVPPEGSLPTAPGDMPYGMHTQIHMPFNVAFHDKDAVTVK